MVLLHARTAASARIVDAARPLQSCQGLMVNEFRAGARTGRWMRFSR